MPLQKTDAIVLKSFRQGETSKILTLYSRAFGKIQVIAKGARSTKSKFGGSLESYNYVSIVYYYKENRDLQTLSQADIVQSFENSKQDLQKTTLSMAVCELVNRLEHGAVPNPALFRLLIDVLRAINMSRNPLHIFHAFEVHLSRIMGFAANFQRCLKCENQAPGKGAFDLRQGGYFCERCNTSESTGILLSEEALSALRRYQNSNLTNLNGFAISSSTESKLDEFLFAYLRYHNEGLRELNSLKFLKKLVVTDI